MTQRKNHPFKKISDWFDSFTKSGQAEYQLDKHNIPEYKQIKQAHQLLLKEYVRAIAAVSRLSFFVGFHEIKLQKEGVLRRFAYLLLAYSPLRLLTWKPLVKLFIEAHVHDKLSELSIIYTQTAFLVAGSLFENSEYMSWLKQAKQECDELQQTLSSGRIFFDSLKAMSTFFFGLFLLAVGARSLGDLILGLFSNSLPSVNLALIVLVITILVFTMVYMYFFWDAAFAAKRVIFMGVGLEISEKHNIYVFENEVFKLLGRGKPREIPIDYLSQFVFQASVIFFLLWFQSQIDKFVSTIPNSISLPCFSASGIIMCLVLLGDVLLPWYKRFRQGYM